MPLSDRWRDPQTIAAARRRASGSPVASPSSAEDTALNVQHAALSVRPRTDQTTTAWLALALVSLAGLAIVTAVVASHIVVPFDKPFLDVATTWTALTPVWNLFSTLGNLPMIPIGLGFVAWLWWKGRHREAILVFLLLAAATVTTEGLKVLIARARPTSGGGGANIIPGTEYSFPSGHSFEDVMILGMIGLKVWRRLPWRLIAGLFVILVIAFVIVVEISRVALATHYPSDMLAGIFGGFAALGLYGWWSRPGGWADDPPEPERDRG